MRTEIERFEAKFTPEPNTGCWLWFGTTTHNGYGQFGVGRKTKRAHHVALRLYRGKTLPSGMVTDHLCRVRECVNPDHLEFVTPGENIRRGLTGDVQRRKTECKSGHAFQGDNVYLEPVTRFRKCRICRRRAQLAFYDRKRKG